MLEAGKRVGFLGSLNRHNQGISAWRLSTLITRKRAFDRLVVLPVFALAICGSAKASDSGATSSAKLEEMIVTAERTEQSSQDIAASLTVFEAVALEHSGLSSLQDIDLHVPNVILSDQGSPRFSINSVRGISSAVRDDYFSQTIGIYIDGVPATAAEYTRALTDVQRIEVLRGPQGTLYGRNTPGGIISIITKQADSEMRAEFAARVGDNRQRGATAMLSGSLGSDSLLGKVFVDYVSRDGFTDYARSGDSIDDLESLSGSASLLYKVADTTSVRLSATVEDIDQGAYAFQAFDRFADRVLDITSPNREDRKIETLTLSVDHDFSGMSFQSITGLRYYDVIADQDLAYNPAIVTYGGGRSRSNEEGDQFSQEFRLSGQSAGERLRWLIGAFYSSDTVDYDYWFDVPAFGDASLSSSSYDRTELAVYAESTFTVGDNFDLTAGVRASRDKHQLVNNYGADGDIDFDIVTPKLRMAYRFGDDAQVYILASRGSRTGGFSRFSAGDSYDPEFLWNYELGLKSQWLDQRLVFNAAVFYIDWQDQQIKTEIGPRSTKIVNSGDSHNTGVELELAWQVSPSFYVGGFWGVNDGEYDSFSKSSTQDLSGNTLVNTADYNAGLVAEYRAPIINGAAQAWFRPEISYVGEHYFDAENTLLQDAYTLVNLNAGIDKGDYSVSMSIKNVFDEDYRVYAYTDNISLYDLAIAGGFRTVLLSVKARF